MKHTISTCNTESIPNYWKKFIIDIMMLQFFKFYLLLRILLQFKNYF